MKQQLRRIDELLHENTKAKVLYPSIPIIFKIFAIYVKVSAMQIITAIKFLFSELSWTLFIVFLK
jgi:hypothetical protein